MSKFQSMKLKANEKLEENIRVIRKKQSINYLTTLIILKISSR